MGKFPPTKPPKKQRLQEGWFHLPILGCVFSHGLGAWVWGSQPSRVGEFMEGMVVWLDFGLNLRGSFRNSMRDVEDGFGSQIYIRIYTIISYIYTYTYLLQYSLVLVQIECLPDATGTHACIPWLKCWFGLTIILIAKVQVFSHLYEERDSHWVLFPDLELKRLYRIIGYKRSQRS